MTREQHKEYNAENYPASVLTWLNEATDRAFDGFDKQLNEMYEDIENRNCNNCKTKNCSIRRVLMELEEINPDYFSCNDWEPKNETW